MKLLEYIKGLRKGKDAHRIESDAMKDPFLSEALEGYDSVKGDHIERISRMQEQVFSRTRTKTASWRYLSVAAGILLCVSIGGYFFLQEKKPDLYSSTGLNKPDTIRSLPRSDKENVTFKRVDEEKKLDEILEKPVGKGIVTEKLQEERPLIVSHPDLKTSESAAAMESQKIRVDSEKDLAEIPIVMDTLTLPSVAMDTTSPILIAMNPNKALLEEVVVVAYGTSKKDRQQEKARESEPIIGRKDYEKYLKNNLIYPTDSACMNKRGTVILRFSVNEEGTPVNVSVKKSLCESFDREAIRLLQEGCKWTPGTVVELKVKF